MNKRLLLSMAIALGVSSAYAYNEGDYVTTRNGRYRITSANLMTNGIDDFTTINGGALSADTFEINPTGGPDGGIYFKVLKSATISKDESRYMTANFHFGIPVSEQQYIVTYKVKGYNPTEYASTVLNGRTTPYQNFYLNANGDIDLSTDASYASVADWVTYTDAWTTFNFDFVPSSTQGFINALFYNLATEDELADFGVYTAQKVLDTEYANECKERLQFYKDHADLFPNGQDDLTEMIAGVDDALSGDGDEASLENILNDATVAVLDANTFDVTGYYTNFSFDGLSAGSKRLANGWSSDIGAGRWGINASEYNFTTGHVFYDMPCNYAADKSWYYQTVNLPAGQYLYAVRAQAFTYFKDGSGGSSNYYIPNFYLNVPGLAFKVNSDSIALENVPTNRGKLYQHVFTVAEDGPVTIGFYCPGSPSDLVQSNYQPGGGRFIYDNVLLRRIGTMNPETYVYQQKVDAALASFKVVLDSAKVVVKSADYVFGQATLQDSINVADQNYALTPDLSDEGVAAINGYQSNLEKALRAFYRANTEYTTLASNLATAKEEIAANNRPNGLADFQAVVTEADNYYKAVQATDVPDSLVLVALSDYSDKIVAARTTWHCANASAQTPASLVIQNPFFQSSRSYWTLVEQDSSKGPWKVVSDDRYEGGKALGVARGYSAAQQNSALQEVTLPAAGYYEYRCQAHAMNTQSGQYSSMKNEDGTLNTGINLIIAVGTDTAKVENVYTTQTTFGNNVWTIDNVETFSVYYNNASAEPVSAWLGMDALGNTHCNIYGFGSNHLYLWGDKDTYEAGITGVPVDVLKMADAPVYNLMGVKVANGRQGLTKGLYIQNGKKFVVK